MSVTVERRGHLLLIGLDRVDKRNSFTTDMLAELAAAYGELERDPDAWVGVLFAHGDHFTAGLDLAQVAPTLTGGSGLPLAEGSVDPWGVSGAVRTKPLVAAAQGWCLTLGIELLLACDVRVAAEGTRFAQIEIQRGIYPFGGATVRMPQAAGWGNAMRWLLTGDEFDAAEAYRIGLVNRVVPGAELLGAADAMLRQMLVNGPLALSSCIESVVRGTETSLDDGLNLEANHFALLAGSQDMAEGTRAFLEKRPAIFAGR